MSTTTTGAASASPTESLLSRLYNGGTTFEFVRRWRLWVTLSAAVIGIGLVSLVTFGLTLGIDFKGGTAWELPRHGLTVDKVRDLVGPTIGREVPIQTVGNDRIRVKGEKSTAKQRDEVAATLAKAAGIDKREVDITFVGPSWGKDVSNKAVKALVVFFLVIAAYISMRFEWKMAAAALAAVVHDIAVTVGVYSLLGKIFGIEVTPATVIAFLTILGFSLYDTIVVFDKVAENVKHSSGQRLTYTDIVNLSMNQVLMRSINTSFVALLPITSMLVLGAGVMGATALGDFGLALFIGLLTGAYSSIFVASPLLALFKERETKWAQLRRKLGTESRLGDASAAAPGADESGRSVYPGAAPRPRKQGKRR